MPISSTAPVACGSNSARSAWKSSGRSRRDQQWHQVTPPNILTKNI
jgi:hypothetical protein